MNKSRYFTIPTQINNYGRKKKLIIRTMPILSAFRYEFRRAYIASQVQLMYLHTAVYLRR